MNKQAFVVELTQEEGFQRLIPGEPQTCGMKSGRVIVQPGNECGVHSTKDREEMLVFLAGSGTAIIGEENEEMEVAAGRVAYIPPQTVHNIRNTGNEPLMYVYCTAPVSD